MTGRQDDSSTATSAATILRVLLIEIDEGRIEATAPERAYLVGVVDTLDAMADRPPPVVS